MKFLIVLFVVAISSALIQCQINVCNTDAGHCHSNQVEKNLMVQISQRTECVFGKSSNLLSCHGPKSVVECETELTWGELIKFELYGIAKCDECTENMFRIISRKMDNSAWMSENSAYLFSSGKIDGLRIIDKKCYAKLNQLFKESLRNEKVFLESTDEKIAYIIGDLLIAESMPRAVMINSDNKKKQKRIVQNLYDQIDAIREVLKEEFDETMTVKKNILEKINNFEKKMLRRNSKIRQKRHNSMTYDRKEYDMSENYEDTDIDENFDNDEESDNDNDYVF